MSLSPSSQRSNGPQLLRWHIDLSGKTIRGYASALFRSERTVSRWLDGETTIPRSVLQHLLAEHDRAGRPPLPSVR